MDREDEPAFASRLPDPARTRAIREERACPDNPPQRRNDSRGSPSSSSSSSSPTPTFTKPSACAGIDLAHDRFVGPESAVSDLRAAMTRGTPGGEGTLPVVLAQPG